MTIILVLAVLTAIVIAWVTYLRPWLRKKAWAEPFFLAIERVELVLYKKSEGIAWARWLQFLGLVSAAAGLLGGIDWTWLAYFTPDHIDPLLPLIPLALNALGTIAGRLRNDTTKPIELVAIPEAEKAKPEVAAALAEANIAKVQAVAVVKAEGVL